MATAKFDYKKEYRDLYVPGVKPVIQNIPAMPFIMIAGTGDPNDTQGQYSHAMELLYACSYTIKMSKMSEQQPEGYFEYVVPPLEGLWWSDSIVPGGLSIADKSVFSWIAMIRQPDFVTPEVFAWAIDEVARKKPNLDTTKARFEVFEEGLCAQIMHKGPYDDEPATIAKLDAFITEQGYTPDISDAHSAFPLARRHHEIYLGDPRKGKPENLKTVIRHPIR